MPNYLEERCKNCMYYNQEEPPLYCDFTGSPLRCNTLKRNVKRIKFKEKLL